MPATEAQKRAKAKYEAKKYDKILLRIARDGDLTKEHIEIAAARTAQSLNAYILEAVQEKMPSPLFLIM